MNLYAYVWNEPTGFNDPFGLFFGFGGLGRAGGGLGSGNGSCGGGGDENWWDLLEQGYYYGTGYGDEATDWWADRFNTTGGWTDPMFYVYGTGGLFSSLWTSDTWMGTAGSLQELV